MARPSKYFTHVEPKLNLVEAWARDGLVDEEIAKNLGIGLTSFYEYKLKYAEFAESLKNGKDDIDIIVENALLKRAVGFEYEEETREPLYNPVTGEPILNEEGKPMIVTTKVVRKMVNPDTTAQIFWLKNRRPKQWRDKQDIEHSGSMKTEVQHNLKKLSPKELAELEHIIAKSADSG